MRPPLRLPASRPYAKLSAVVSGRDVAVICDKNVALQFDRSVVTLRFNSDAVPADIWATSFWGEPSIAQAANAQLVLGLTPDAVVNIESHRVTKNFPAERDRYLKNLFIDQERLELIDTEHWHLLRQQSPAIPQAGIATLAMLEQTSIRTCTIHGMTFYLDQDIQFNHGRWHTVHDLFLSCNWVADLLDRDSRFVFVGPIKIQEYLRKTRARLDSAGREYIRYLENLEAERRKKMFARAFRFNHL